MISYAGRGSRRRFRFVVPAIVLFAAACLPADAGVIVSSSAYVFSIRDLTVTFIDVGQGDGILLKTPSGRFVLIDGGPADEGKTPLVLDFLKRSGVTRIDAAVVSHPHPDHAGGMAAALRDFPAGCFYDSGFYGDQDNEQYRACREIVAEKKLRRTPVAAGDRIDLGDGIRLQVLAPHPGSGFERSNDHSLVLKVTYGRVSFLLPGDAESEEENWLLSSCPGSLSSVVLKVPHHGSYTSSNSGFLAAVRPEACVISCGYDNPFNHPHTSVLARLRRQGIRIFRTDYGGNVRFVTDGKVITVQTDKAKN